MIAGETPWDRKLCSECKEGQVQVRVNRRTQELFYACRNPDCYTTWNIEELNEWTPPK